MLQFSLLLRKEQWQKFGIQKRPRNIEDETLGKQSRKTFSAKKGEYNKLNFKLFFLLILDTVEGPISPHHLVHC